MTELLGVLDVPIPVPEPGDTVADPFLDLLAAFLQAAINADTKDAWAAVHPATVKPASEPVPVVFAKTHNPTEASFRSNELPSLFVYRGKSGARRYVTQDWQVIPTMISILWVPPRAQQETMRLRQSFRHGVEAAIERALWTGRTPGWVQPGDPDPSAGDFGSYFYTFAGLWKYPGIHDATDYMLKLPAYDGNMRQLDQYDCTLITLEIEEILQSKKDRYSPLAKLSGSLGGPDGLPVIPFDLIPTVQSVTPSSGTSAGGTAIAIAGLQFFEEPYLDAIAVTIGGVACTGVTFLNESTLQAVTSAGTAGAKDVVVTMPNGASSPPLVGGFTFT